MNETVKTNFVKGALILAIAGFTSRFLGLFYRIIITRLIGAEGIGLFQTAYPIYTTLLTISISGIPVALARLVSESIALNRWNDALRIFKVARRMSLILGGLIFILIFFLARPLITLLDLDPRSYYTVLAISPAILIVSVMASYRGFFQGMQNMLPTAYSQIVEQVVRMATMIILAYLLLPYGIEISAAGATFSAVTGSLAGFLVLLIIYYKQKKIIHSNIDANEVFEEKVITLIKRIVSYVIPVTLGALVVPLMSLVDLIFVPHRLQVLGFTVEEATALYGELTGVALVLVHFPVIITSSLQLSLIPSISTAYTLKQDEVISKRTGMALRYAAMVGLPSSVGLFILAEPLCKIIFGVPTAAVPLRVVAWSVFFIALQQTSSGVLQGMGLVKISAKNLLIGAMVNALINYTLTAMPRFGIKGAALGTLLGFTTAAALNILSLHKRIKLSFSFINLVLKPGIASLIMMVGVFFSHQKILIVSKRILPFLIEPFSLLFSVFVGVILFFISLLALGGIKEEDFRMIPGMKSLINPLQKIGLLRS